MIMFGRIKKTRLPTREEALPGRSTPIPVAPLHRVKKVPMTPPFPAGIEQVLFGLGCFWGAERLFWKLRGVYTTAAGYAGGHTPNPTYEEVCSGGTGHTEAVLVAFDPATIKFTDLLAVFWEAHDPTQGMGQGNDIGTQYRSAIYWYGEAQHAAAEESRRVYAAALAKKGYPAITTEIAPAGAFYYAEDYHQQYLDKNPRGYCGLQGTGVACAI